MSNMSLDSGVRGVGRVTPLHVVMERLGLARFFDVMLDSHLEGVEKPDLLAGVAGAAQ